MLFSACCDIALVAEPCRKRRWGAEKEHSLQTLSAAGISDTRAAALFRSECCSPGSTGNACHLCNFDKCKCCLALAPCALTGALGRCLRSLRTGQCGRRCSPLTILLPCLISLTCGTGPALLDFVRLFLGSVGALRCPAASP